MKTSLYLRIGIIMSLIYYFLDALLDTFIFYKDSTFLDILILDVPLNELYNRFMAIILIVIALLLIRLFSLKDRKKRAIKKKSVFSDLNNISVVELVGHQLKTSLSTIIGFTNMMIDKDINDNTRSMYSEYVYTSSTSLLNLFNNLLDMNRLADGKYKFDKDACRVNKMMDELKKKYEFYLSHKRAHKVNLKLDVPYKTKHLLLTTDCRKLQKVLSTMIENALEFTQVGSITFGYTLEGDSRIQFFVSDEGAGLSMENLEASFHEYFKSSKSVESSFDLAGLRLMVGKGFAELIDGKIWSSSRPGIGSTFYLALDIKEQEQKEISEKVQESKTPDWSGVKILIAEDVEPNYLLLKELLKLTKAEVIWAKDGKEAVNYFSEHSTEIDIVLMDIVMPEMDGFEAAEKIREMSANIPIIGQTAYSLEFEKNTEQLKNFNDYLTKPIWYHELINIVGKYL